MNSVSSCCDRLLSNEKAAEILGISPRTLANWRVKGWGPRYSRLTDSPRSLWFIVRATSRNGLIRVSMGGR